MYGDCWKGFDQVSWSFYPDTYQINEGFGNSLIISEGIH